MKQILASILVVILTVAMALAAMFALVIATEHVTAIDSTLQRVIAIGAELLLGVVLLLGTVWVATHFAVRIFGTKDSPSEGGLLA
jgi:ABC-type microcin C transport system duplicated ATPase subunit YejF